MAKLPGREELDRIKEEADNRRRLEEELKGEQRKQAMDAAARVAKEEHDRIIKQVLDSIPGLMREAAARGFTEDGSTGVAVLRLNDATHMSEPYKDERSYILNALKKEVEEDNPGYRVCWHRLRPAIGARRDGEAVQSGSFPVEYGNQKILHTTIKAYVPENLLETKGVKGQPPTSGMVIFVAHGGIFALKSE